MILLRDSTELELALFSQLEQDPSTRNFIAPYSLAQHQAEFLKQETLYKTIISQKEGAIVGFLILILDEDGQSLGLKRLVIGPKCQGYGSAALAALEEFCRSDLRRRLIWLDVFADNAHARHVYEKAGFVMAKETDYFSRPLLIYEKDLAPACG